MQAILRKATLILCGFLVLMAGFSSTASAQSLPVSCVMAFTAPGAAPISFAVDSSSSNIINVNDLFQPNSQYTASLQSCSQTLVSASWVVDNLPQSGSDPTFTTPAGGTPISVSVLASFTSPTTLSATLNSSTIVPPVPVCTLTANPATLVAGGSATLTANCTGAPTSYTWTNTNFASTAASGTVTPTSTTTYTVTATNTSGTSAPAAATVTVTAPPAPVCTISGAPSDPVAAGTPLTLAAVCSGAPMTLPPSRALVPGAMTNLTAVLSSGVASGAEGV